MSEKKNIDKLFKEQFKDFEVAPSDAVWKNIERELHKDKRKRRVIPIWWKMAGVAAALILMLTAGNFILNTNSQSDSQNPAIVDVEKSPSTQNNSDDSSEILSHEEILRNNRNSNDVDDIQSVSAEGKKQDFVNSEELASEQKSKAKQSIKNQNNKFEAKDAIVNANDVQEPLKKDALKGSKQQSSQLNKNPPTNDTWGKTKNSLAKNSDFIGKGKSKKGNYAEGAVVGNDNLSKPNSKSNKNSENALIDSSKADALISNSKSDSRSAVTDNSTAEKNESINEIETAEAAYKANDIEEAIALNNDAKAIEKEEEERLNRWSVSPNVAPVYFNSLGQEGSSLDNQFSENAKQGQINMSYGVGGSYAISKKLKIRTGVNRVDLGYRTNDVLVFNSVSPAAARSGSDAFVNARSAPQQFSNVNVVQAHANHNFMSSTNLSARPGPNQLLTQEQISLDQNLGFIEVPIEIAYSVVESKFGLNVIGGFSTLFLNNNEIFAVQDGNSSYFGEATNINDMSYSANFGIGLNYNISKQFRFNLEPTFKYQINTFNNTSGDFEPYIIGLYTGLSFKF